MTECEDAFDRLIASTKTTEVSSVGKNTLDSDSEDEIAQRIHSKKAVLEDSSDEDDPPVTFKKGILDFNCNGKEEEVSEVNTPSDDEEIGHRKKPAKRIKKLLDDSDDEPEVSQSHKPVDLDVDRPSPPRSGENSDSESSVRSTRSSRSSKSGRSSSDSSSGEESEGEVSIEAIKSKIINKHIPPKSSKLLEGVGQDPEKKGNSKPKKEKAPSRKAKEAALAEIHSETQRMIRERQVSLPYHKPKQRSLADFLNRRKLAPTVRLKTSSDELAKVWKHAEEREKTAELFYRSDSDEETEKIDNKENESSKADEPAIPRSDPVEFSRDNDTTTADRLQDLLDQPTASVSQPLDSEEFPRLLLSEVLVDSENTEEGNSLKCVDPVVENDVALNKESCDAVDSAEKSDAVTMDVADDATIAPVKDSELVENSENMTDSVVLEDSVPLSGLSQNSLCEKISSLNLPIPKCPRISGAPDEVIDLDELSTKPGAFGLMQRFIKHSKLKSKVIQQQNVLSVMTSEVNDCGEIINLSEETIKVNKKVEPKPGERLVVLQTTLKQKMAMNRGQQLAKKLEEYKLYEEEFYGVVGNDEGEEDMFSEDECGGKEEKEEKEIEADVNNPFLEDEAAECDNDGAAESDNEDAAESDNDGAAEDEEDGANEDDAEGSDVEETASVLLGDASDEEGDSDTCPVSENEDVEDDVLPTPPIPTALHSLAGTQNTDSINESQLMALCSGNFSSSTIDLKVLETSSEAFQNTEDEGSKVPNPQDSPKYAIDSDDEEILVSKKQKNKKRKLSFSDDEENDGAENDGAALGESDDDEPIKLSLNDDDTAERNEEVESDEENVAEDDNLIEDEDDEEVLLAKKLSKGFLDKEAELSESEWGSEDEDEKGMDQYEAEEGDQDKISQRRLQKELGKIHMREVLADDNREIRILQELLLEDGELHSDGPKRQRLFRWYNQDEDNPGERKPLEMGENANENDEEDEDLWRRQRLERENYLRKKKIDNLDLEIVETPVNFNDTRKSLKVTPKITPTANKSPDPKSNFNIFAKRGSFLGRGEKMLSKLAEITNNAGSKENAFGNTRNNRNMVFSIVSPPKEKQDEEQQPEAPLKRKGDFTSTSIVKKIKFTRNNVTTKVSALDQLKLFEST